MNHPKKEVRTLPTQEVTPFLFKFIEEVSVSKSQATEVSTGTCGREDDYDQDDDY